MRYLSRGYAYDQVGRVVDNSGPNGLPLRQSYGYDQFGNMTARWGTYFFQASQSQTAAYVNNRRTDWSYDAQGQITNVPASATDSANTFTYDAAGQLVTRVQTTGSVITTFTQGYDGDGELISAVTAPAGGSSTSGYDIRSSVLGTVLTELDQSGNKRSTHVSADGLLFASQNINSAGAWVSSIIRNPVGTGESTGAIYDPLGNYIPFQHYNDPRPPAGSYNSGSMSSLTRNQANPDSYGVGCRIDGVPTSCNRVLQAINRGEAKTLVLYGASVEVALANMGLFLVKRPVWLKNEVAWRYSLFAFIQPQNPPTVANATTDQQSRFDAAYKNFLKRLNANKGKNPCAKLFGGVKKAMQVINQTHFAFAPVTDGAAETVDTNINIDPGGSFMSVDGKAPVSTPSFGPSPFSHPINDTSQELSLNPHLIDGRPAYEVWYVTPPDDVTAASFILAHEIGHRRGVFGKNDFDGGDSLAIGLNNEVIRKACFSELKPQPLLIR